MATPTAPKSDLHATTESTGWSTRRIAITALMCAVAAIATLFIEFPIIPGITFLKYDPSAVIALIAGFAFGPGTGAVVSILPYLVHLGTESGLYGTMMAVIATLSLVLPASIIYQRGKTQRSAVIGLAVGAIICLAFCIGANIIITPLYMGTSTETVINMIVPALLPFNIAKIAINCVITLLIFKPVSRAFGE